MRSRSIFLCMLFINFFIRQMTHIQVHTHRVISTFELPALRAGASPMGWGKKAGIFFGRLQIDEDSALMKNKVGSGLQSLRWVRRRLPAVPRRKGPPLSPGNPAGHSSRVSRALRHNNHDHFTVNYVGHFFLLFFMRGGGCCECHDLPVMSGSR